MKTLGTWTEALAKSQSPNKDNSFYQQGFLYAWVYYTHPSNYKNYAAQDIALYNEGWEDARKIKMDMMLSGEWQDDGISENAFTTYAKIAHELDKLYDEAAEPTIYASNIAKATINAIKNVVSESEKLFDAKEISREHLNGIKCMAEMRIELLERKHGGG